VVTDRFRRAPLDVALRMEIRLPTAKQIASMGIDCEAGQELLCHRNQTVNFFNKLECDSCGRILSCYFYHLLGPHLKSSAPLLITDTDCCRCSGDDNDICLECWNSGERCLDEDHLPSLRVMAGDMISCVEYSPWIADMSFTTTTTTPRHTANATVPTATPRRSTPISTREKSMGLDEGRSCVGYLQTVSSRVMGAACRSNYQCG
jgi:hypothetical protein